MEKDTANSSFNTDVGGRSLADPKPHDADRNTPKMLVTFAAGINQNQNPDTDEASDGFNFELGPHQTSLTARAPFDLAGTAPNVQPVTGINQMVTRAGTKTTLVTAGTVTYEWSGGSNQTVAGTTTSGTKHITGLADTSVLVVGMLVTGTGIGTAPNVITSIDSSTQVSVSVNSTASATVSVTFTAFTSVGTVTAPALFRSSYWALGDYLVVTDLDLNNVVKKWDGTTFANMTTGLGATAFGAKYSVVFLNRMWYFNIYAGTFTPHLIVASTYQDPTNLSVSAQGGPTDQGGAGAATFPTGLEAFFLVTPDLKPINSVAVFQNYLLISTQDGQVFQLTGTDANTFQFVPYFTGSSSTSNEAMINIGNDVIYVRKGGNINLLASVNYQGDVKSNDIARWLPNITKSIRTAIAAYDQQAQKVYFFTNNQVLVLFKNILYESASDSDPAKNLSPWSVYTTQHANNFTANVAQYMYATAPNDSSLAVFYGDNLGNVMNMSGTGKYGDGGTVPINVSRTTTLIDTTEITPFPWQEKILFGKVQYRRQGSPATMNVNFTWSDELSTSTSTIILKGIPGYWNYLSFWGGGSYWQRQAFVALNAIGHQTFSPTGKGSGFTINLQCLSLGGWVLDRLELY
jgi:hypothetical protein